MKCKKCAQKDVLLDALQKDHENVIKLNGEILELARSVNNSNKELMGIIQALRTRVNELENQLKEAADKSCSNDSTTAQ